MSKTSGEVVGTFTDIEPVAPVPQTVTLGETPVTVAWCGLPAIKEGAD